MVVIKALRFANTIDNWGVNYDDGIWVTHDGGDDWSTLTLTSPHNCARAVDCP